MSHTDTRELYYTGRWLRYPLWIGVVAIAVCAIGGQSSPDMAVSFFRAYLASFVFFLGIGLGSMALLMVYHLTSGSWGFLIRRFLEAAMRTLPLLAVLFVPIAWGIRYLYVWAQPEMVEHFPKLQYQQFYLAPKWFWIRAAIYFALWIGMAFFLGAWSRRQDDTGHPRLAWMSQQLSALGAVVYGVSLHFAAVDWVMSLNPTFHSTIWGPLFAAGQLLSGLAFALVVLALLVDRPPLAEVVSDKVRRDLGSLLLVFVILWAYMEWFQFMLIWIANMKVDVIWYLPRGNTAWLCVIWAIVVLHFAVPFFLLLMRPIKRNSKAVAWIAGLLLLMQLVFDYYQVLPEVAVPTEQIWLDILLPIGMGGIWLAYYVVQLRRLPLVALHDYNRVTALHLRSLDAEDAEREEALAHG